MKLEFKEMNSFELKCISFKKQDPKVLRVDIEQKGITKVFKLKMEEYPKMTIKNNTDLTFKVNQKDFESYGEFISAHESLNFFWDDPFSEQTLYFQRLFNNKISDEKIVLELSKLTKKVTKLVEINPNTLETDLIENIKSGGAGFKLELSVEKNARTDCITIDLNYAKKDKSLRKLMVGYGRHQLLPLAAQESSTLKIFTQIKKLSVSLIDEKPKEILFLSFDGAHFNNMFKLDSLEWTDVTAAIMDFQADFQINRASNKVLVRLTFPGCDYHSKNRHHFQTKHLLILGDYSN